MATRQNRGILRQFHTLFNVGTIGDLGDGQLLERFATSPRELAELAFAALLERHGPMVLRVCRGVLGNVDEAEDAFQATFLILVSRARGLWIRDSLGPWLHQVAFRTASCTRAAALRRQRHEQRAAARIDAVVEPGIDFDLERRLHEEIARLPERYRVPIVLCDLEGHTCEEAARRMGRPVGTVKCWRARGRDELRRRLIRSGLAVAGIERVLTAASTHAAVSTAMAETTVRAAIQAGSGVTATVLTLVKGVLRTMVMEKLRTTAVGLVALGLVVAGLGAAVRVSAGDTKGPAAPPAAAQPPRPVAALPDKPGEAWSMSLPEAIRIGLENSEFLRVLEVQKVGPAGVRCVIARLSADAPITRFRSEAMAEVRSIEQQYWSLAMHQAQLRAAEQAVQIAEEILRREEAVLNAGRGTQSDVAEARQRLEELRLNLVMKTTGVAMTERQLRKLIGLPIIDQRRIVPSTSPMETRVDPNWDASLATMYESQPDIMQARYGTGITVAGTAEFLKTHGTTPVTPADSDWQTLARRILLQQVIHQTTHSLARFLLEIDANYKQFKTASRSRAAAAERMELQRAFYEEGRITIERYLDAVSQYTQAVAMEAQYKMSYNISLVAFEEAKGTLLESRGIVVAENLIKAGEPGDAKTVKPRRPASPSVVPLPMPAPVGPTLASAGPFPPAPVPGPTSFEKPAPPAPDAGKTVSFHFTIGLGPKPLEIRGSFTVAPARIDPPKPGP